MFRNIHFCFTFCPCVIWQIKCLDSIISRLTTSVDVLHRKINLTCLTGSLFRIECDFIIIIGLCERRYIDRCSMPFFRTVSNLGTLACTICAIFYDRDRSISTFFDRICIVIFHRGIYNNSRCRYRSRFASRCFCRSRRRIQSRTIYFRNFICLCNLIQIYRYRFCSFCRLFGFLWCYRWRCCRCQR